MKKTADSQSAEVYSNYLPNIDWSNIEEITWMYKQGLIRLSSKVLVGHDQFEKRLDILVNVGAGRLREGESLAHLALKLFAKDYLIQYMEVNENEIWCERPLIGFEVDVIDKKLRFPVECGDTNPLKLEKYLHLPTTEKFFVLPYPHLKNLEIFEFFTNPSFFEYIKHKQTFLNKKNSRFR